MRKIILLFVFFIVLSCGKINNLEDVRQIKTGMSVNEVKYFLGEPEIVDVENGYEEWQFEYRGDYYNNTFVITIVNEKVYDFRTY